MRSGSCSRSLVAGDDAGTGRRVGRPRRATSARSCSSNRARTDVDARKKQLERDSAELRRAESSAPKPSTGVRRDAKLQELLAAQKPKSDELERLASEVRGRASLLAGARRS